MTYSLAHRPQATLRVGLILAVSTALWLASAVSLAPALSQPVPHSEVCKCAHCPGELTCCCRIGLNCP